MKGLIYKELYLSRKLRIIDLCVFLLLLIMSVLVKLSALYGNIGHLGEASVRGVNGFMFYFLAFTITPVALTLGQMTNTVAEDEKSRFRIFSRTLPVTEKQAVGAVYILNLISLGCCILVNFVMYFAALAMFGGDFKAKDLITIVGINAVLYMLMHFKVALNYLIRNPKKAAGIFALICTAIYFGIAEGIMGLMDRHVSKYGYDLGSDDIPDEVMNSFYKETLMEPFKWLADNAWWLLPTVVLGLCVLSYFLSVKGLKRRDG
ncbi:MAG: ABC-2 transporter permease [Ruminococcus sp.]|nr:ABC-2 transporter permease [Ruminococcus sp.]